MSKKQKKRVGIRSILSQNIYGLKLAYGYSKSRVICSFFSQFLDYLLWVFYSSFFVKIIISILEKNEPVASIVYKFILIGGLTILAQGFRHFCYSFVFPTQNVKLLQGIYNRIYKKAENVELNCYEQSEFYNKFSIALDKLGSKLYENIDNMTEIISGTICGIIACATMISIDWVTILFLVAPFVGNFIFAPAMSKIYYNRGIDAVPSDRKIAYIDRVMYLEKYSKEIRVSRIYDVLHNIFNRAVDEKSGIWKNYIKRAFPIGILQYFFSYIVIFEGILLYGGYKALVRRHRPIDYSDMAVLTSVMVTASWVWVRVINAVNRNSQLSHVIKNVREFLEYSETIPEDFDGVNPPSVIESIEFEHVSFSYDGKKKVMDDLCFVIHSMDNIALVGHNGAGKSTLIKLLLRLYDPTEGRILVNGIDIKTFNLRKYRDLFSCMFQTFQIYPNTIKENVLMGKDGTDEMVIEALQRTGVYERVAQCSKGIHSVMTKEFDNDGENFSGGERQKIAAARVFVSDSAICIFDEPSSALDPIAEGELFDQMQEFTKNRIGVYISHRLSCVKKMDWILMLEQGKIIEQGTHMDLIQKHGAYADLYEMQEKNYYTISEEDTIIYE